MLADAMLGGGSRSLRAIRLEGDDRGTGAPSCSGRGGVKRGCKNKMVVIKYSIRCGMHPLLCTFLRELL